MELAIIIGIVLVFIFIGVGLANKSYENEKKGGYQKRYPSNNNRKYKSDYHRRQAEFWARNREKGEKAEKEVAALLDKHGFWHLDDIYLPHPDLEGESTQIDHLVYLGNKLVSIETKAYSGDIYFNPDSNGWDVTTDNKTYHLDGMKNPIVQNRLHVRSVTKMGIPCWSIICLAGTAEFNGRRPKYVHQIDYLIKALQKISSKNDDEVYDFWMELCEWHKSDLHQNAKELHLQRMIQNNRKYAA